MKKQIFRPAALARLNNPEELDILIQVTDRRAWLSLLGLLGLAAIALVWAVFGSIPNTLAGEGLLLRQDSLYELRANAPGLVSEIRVKVGARVQAGDALAMVKTEQEGDLVLRSPEAATVLEILAEKNSPVKSDSPLIRLELSDRPLQAIIFVPLAEGKRLRPGTAVQLGPSTTQRESYGDLLGEVGQVSQFPVSSESLLALLKNEELVKSFTNDGPLLRVDVTLQPEPANTSGFKWSASAGPPFQLSGGTPCSARLITGEQSPLSLILPAFRNKEL